MSKFKYIHYFPPSFFTSTIDGQKYIVPSWIPVPNDTKISDVEWVNLYVSESVNTFQRTEKEWDFESSSKPGTFYSVRVNGQLSCSCPGAWSAKSKECKHIKEVKQELTKQTPITV